MSRRKAKISVKSAHLGSPRPTTVAKSALGAPMSAMTCEKMDAKMMMSTTIDVVRTVSWKARLRARHVEVADRGFGHHAVDDHRDRGRNEDPQRPARGQGAADEGAAVAALLHFGDRDHADGRRRRHAGAGDRREDRAGEDAGDGKPARQEADPARDGREEPPADARVEKDRAHEDEERDRDEGEAGGVRPRDRPNDAEPDRPALEPEQPEHADDAERHRDLEPHREQDEHQRDEERAEDGFAQARRSGGGASSRPSRGPRLTRTCRTKAASMATAMSRRPAGIRSIGIQSG